MTRQRRPRAVSGFGLIAGAAIIVAFAVGRVATDSSGHAAPSAVAEFRAADPHPAPFDGVYTYETNGSELVDGPHGSSHAYPATTTITVIHTGCGVVLQWNVLPGRSTTWTLCTPSGDVVLRRLVETRGILGNGDRTTYSCAQRPLTFTCSATQGGESVHMSGHIVELGETIVSVAGTNFAALSPQIAATVSGGINGTETTDFRLTTRTFLPLVLSVANETSRKQDGVAVHYREHATLQLLSSTPQR